MIPIELKLRNFLSYGEDVEPLDFTRFKLACLSGRNGHGKSALLDAITWAVWGQARKADSSRSPDADLLRLGAADMSVEFAFWFNNREHRVIRSFRKTRRTSSGALDFKVREPDGGAFTLLTGSHKSETQKHIVDTLGIDYKTFVNSSFLQQGRADQFSQLSPRERKDILATILGLSIYDELQKEAKLRLDETKARRIALEQGIEGILRELEREEPLRAEDKQLQDRLTEHRESAGKLLAEESAAAAAVSELIVTRANVEHWRAAEESLRSQSEETRRRLDALDKEAERLGALTAREEAIRANARRHGEIGQEIKRLLGTEAEYRKLGDEKRALLETIGKKNHQLEVQRAGAQSERAQTAKLMEENRRWLERGDAIGAAYNEYLELRERAGALDRIRPAYEEAQAAVQEAERQIERERQTLEKDIAGKRIETRELESLAKRIEALEKQLAALPAMREAYQALLKRQDEAGEKGQQLKADIERRRYETGEQQKRIAETKEKLRVLAMGESNECPVCNQPMDAAARARLEASHRETIEAAKKRAAELAALVERRTMEIEQRRAEYTKHREALKAKGDEIAALEGRRPTLEEWIKERDRLLGVRAELADLEKKLAGDEYAKEAREKRRALQERIRAMNYDPKAHDELRNALMAKQRHEADWNRLQEARGGEKQLRERMEALERQIAEIEETLKSEAHAKTEREAIKALDETMAPLEKELQGRQALHRELDSLRNAPAELSQLEHARMRLPELDGERKELTERLEKARAEMQALGRKREEAKPALEQLEKHEARARRLAEERKAAEERANAIHQRLGAVRGQLESLERRKRELAESREKIQELANGERHYGILRTAFGRDGIPAMIIEQSLPELEDDANHLLRRLTNGACTVRFESQRETRTGGVRESLDILISDEMGVRDYDMFSGGEAFRTDLAIRIALSQLLCRRAGSQLQLLVIDEGFGTQDAEGLSNIVEAIDEIKDEFEKVLVVTHIEELKDRFRDRIEVYKEPGAGSRFQVLHAG